MVEPPPKPERPRSTVNGGATLLGVAIGILAVSVALIALEGASRPGAALLWIVIGGGAGGALGGAVWKRP